MEIRPLHYCPLKGTQGPREFGMPGPQKSMQGACDTLWFCMKLPLPDASPSRLENRHMLLTFNRMRRLGERPERPWHGVCDRKN